MALKQSDIETFLLAHGIDPSMLSLSEFMSLIRYFESEPPIEVRLDWWLCLIANILYRAHGGRGPMPLPPWLKQSTENSSESVISAVRELAALSAQATGKPLNEILPESLLNE